MMATSILARLDTMEGAIRALESLRQAVAPLARCWECGSTVPVAQCRRSVAAFEAIICIHCEPWVRKVLHREEDRADQEQLEQAYRTAKAR